MAGRAWIVVVGALLFAAPCGCSFDGGKADRYRCGASGACPTGQCIDGVCVEGVDGGATDGGVPDAPAEDGPLQDDGPTATDGPAQHDAGQQDGPTQQDGPAQQDAAQEDAVQEDAPQQDAPPQQDAAAGCVLDPLTSDAGHFTPVLTGASWTYGASGYRQTVTNDLHDTWVTGTDGDHVSIQVSVTPTAQGQAQFDSPTGNFASLAGVLVRAHALTTTSQTAYFCGVDLRNGGRLVLARMSGAYSATHGTMTVITSSPMTVALNGTYPVSADAQGSTISCASGTTQITRTDSTIATGSVGLFTIGAQARFAGVYYCLP